MALKLPQHLQPAQQAPQRLQLGIGRAIGLLIAHGQDNSALLS